MNSVSNTSSNDKNNSRINYDLTAHLYSLFTGMLFLASGTTEGRFRKRIYQQTMPFIEKKKVLDVCCANGKGTEILSSVLTKSTIWGIDLNPNMIYFASKRNNSNPNVHFKVGNCADIPFESNTFDLVSAILALHEIPTLRLKAVLKEIVRVLGHEGLLYVFDFVMPKEPNWFLRLFYYFMRIFEDESAARFMMIDQSKLLEREGFRLVFQKRYLAQFLQVSVYRLNKYQ